MDVDKIFTDAMRKAEYLSEALPIIKGIEQNPHEAFELIINQRKLIEKQDLVIKKLQEKINEM